MLRCWVLVALIGASTPWSPAAAARAPTRSFRSACRTGAFSPIERTQGELSLDAACDDRITGVPPGTYRVLAFASPVIAATTLEVPSGGSVALQTLTLTSGAW